MTDPLIPRERALRIIEILKSSMTYNEAREYLGMPRGAMRNVLDEGVLQPSLRAGTEGLQEHLFLKSDLDALLVRCRGENPRVFRQPPRGHGGIVTAGIRNNSSSATVLRMLVDGTVAAAGALEGKRGLGAVLVEWKRVADAFEARPEGVMTMVEAAKFLGVHFYTLRYLVEAGYLETTEFAETQRKTTRARFIPREAALRFQAEFVPAQELAERLGTHVRVLVPRLATQGITPAISNADAGRYYYRISEVAVLPDSRVEERRPRR